MGGEGAPAGEKGQDGGAGPEQAQGVEEEIPDQRYQGQSREDQGPHYGGQDVARAVASRDHHDLAPYEERGDQRPEEHKRQVSRGEQQHERRPDDGDYEHYAEHDGRRHGGQPEEEGSPGGLFRSPRRRRERPRRQDRGEHATGDEHRRGEDPTHDAEYVPPPGTIEIHPPGHDGSRHSVPVTLYLAAPALKVPGHGGFRPQVHISVLDVYAAAHAGVHAHVPNAGIHLAGYRRAHRDVAEPGFDAPPDGLVDVDVSKRRVDVARDCPVHGHVPEGGEDLALHPPSLDGHVPEGATLEGVGGRRWKDRNECQYGDGEREQRPDIYPEEGCGVVHASRARRRDTDRYAAAMMRSSSAPTATATSSAGPTAAKRTRTTSANPETKPQNMTSASTAKIAGLVPSRLRASEATNSKATARPAQSSRTLTDRVGNAIATTRQTDRCSSNSREPSDALRFNSLS